MLTFGLIVLFVLWFLFAWGFSYYMGILPAMGLALVAVPVALGVLVFWTIGGIFGAIVLRKNKKKTMR